MINGILLADHTRYTFEEVDKTISRYLKNHLKLPTESSIRLGQEDNHSTIYFTGDCYLVHSLVRSGVTFKSEVIRATTMQSLLEHLAGFHGADFAYKAKTEFMRNAYPRY